MLRGPVAWVRGRLLHNDKWGRPVATVYKEKSTSVEALLHSRTIISVPGCSGIEAALKDHIGMAVHYRPEQDSHAWLDVVLNVGKYIESRSAESDRGGMGKLRRIHLGRNLGARKGDRPVSCGGMKSG